MTPLFAWPVPGLYVAVVLRGRLQVALCHQGHRGAHHAEGESQGGDHLRQLRRADPGGRVPACGAPLPCTLPPGSAALRLPGLAACMRPASMPQACRPLCCSALPNECRAFLRLGWNRWLLLGVLQAAQAAKVLAAADSRMEPGLAAELAADVGLTGIGALLSPRSATLSPRLSARRGSVTLSARSDSASYVGNADDSLERTLSKASVSSAATSAYFDALSDVDDVEDDGPPSGERRSLAMHADWSTHGSFCPLVSQPPPLVLASFPLSQPGPPVQVPWQQPCGSTPGCQPLPYISLCEAASSLGSAGPLAFAPRQQPGACHDCPVAPVKCPVSSWGDDPAAPRMTS